MNETTVSRRMPLCDMGASITSLLRGHTPPLAPSHRAKHALAHLQATKRQSELGRAVLIFRAATRCTCDTCANMPDCMWGKHGKPICTAYKEVS